MALISTNESTYYSSSSNYGNYQFVSLSNIIDAFMIVNVGEDKLISKISRADVNFHAQRALAELSYDVLSCVKTQEITVANTLTMAMPQDYVSYVKITRVDENGVERPLYPTKSTSNPTAPKQTGSIGDQNFVDSDGDGKIDLETESDTWARYKASSTDSSSDDTDYDEDLYDLFLGQRYGIDPAYAQINGSFYIDQEKGRIHFSSSLAGKVIILKYISDSLGTEAEMRVHKYAEEAMYKSIAYAVISNRANMPEYVVQRLKKEKRAAIRSAKLRMSKINFEEITQILRGKSKQIKH